MMRGIVVATTVWLSAPRNMASTTQAIEAMACRGGGGVKPQSSSRPSSVRPLSPESVTLSMGSPTPWRSTLQGVAARAE